jgi:hypothetical protein
MNSLSLACVRPVATTGVACTTSDGVHNVLLVNFFFSLALIVVQDESHVARTWPAYASQALPLLRLQTTAACASTHKALLACSFSP